MTAKWFVRLQYRERGTQAWRDFSIFHLPSDMIESLIDELEQEYPAIEFAWD